MNTLNNNSLIVGIIIIAIYTYILKIVWDDTNAHCDAKLIIKYISMFNLISYAVFALMYLNHSSKSSIDMLKYMKVSYCIPILVNLFGLYLAYSDENNSTCNTKLYAKILGILGLISGILLVTYPFLVNYAMKNMKGVDMDSLTIKYKSSY